MTTCSSILAWEIPRTGEPGGLQSMGSQRVRHDWAHTYTQRPDLRHLGTPSYKDWRRQWHPTPVLLPGKSHGWRSLVGWSPWGRQQSDTTEWLHFHALEKETATHSSVLAWRIPGTREPGGLLSMGSHRVRHNGSDLAAAIRTAEKCG